jgi:hypothetical protein
LAVNGTATGRWCSIAAAAAELGLPERVIYRRIATQTLQARRDRRGALLVYLDEQDRTETGGVSTPSLDQREMLLAPDHSRALTEFATGLMNPLVSRLAEQESVIRAQAEELGRLRARADAQVETEDRLAPTLDRQMAELAAIREEIMRLGTRRRWWPF